ncbi:MAG TPA: hypothetical protein VJV78_30890 [Polyangiales bacterium]|nr:hypothetical protein [Polyangiales bacterium]
MANLRVRCSLVVVALCASPACGAGDDEPLYVTMSERSLTADGWQEGGGGCMSISFGGDGPSSGGSVSGTAGVGAVDGGIPPSPLSVARDMTSRGLRVVVTSERQLLAIKLLTTEFLESGEIDLFEVTTRDGVRHEFAHRGAHECESGVDLFAE